MTKAKKNNGWLKVCWFAFILTGIFVVFCSQVIIQQMRKQIEQKDKQIHQEILALQDLHLRYDRLMDSSIRLADKQTSTVVYRTLYEDTLYDTVYVDNMPIITDIKIGFIDTTCGNEKSITFGGLETLRFENR